jgi:DNA-binding response OmpR family regulator
VVVDVALVHWPGDEARRQRLRNRGVARLLLVAPDAEPPAIDQSLEDWVRMPAPEVDVRARVEGLRQRFAAFDTPHIDGDGVVRFGDDWVAVPPVEARLVAAMIDRYGACVGRDILAAAAWPEGSPGRNALDVHMARLRKRLATVELAIRTIRSRGYLLESAA